MTTFLINSHGGGGTGGASQYVNYNYNNYMVNIKGDKTFRAKMCHLLPLGHNYNDEIQQ